MDISIYCRKPSKIELILDELEANINAIVADCHKRLDTLKKPEPVTPGDRHKALMQDGFSAAYQLALHYQALAHGEPSPFSKQALAQMQNASLAYTASLFGLPAPGALSPRGLL